MHKRFTFEIECNNGAFDGSAVEEVARLLRKVADEIQPTLPTGVCYIVRDTNGNTVGHYSMDEY